MGNIRQEDTIAAIATAVSEAGLGVIRISGSHAIEVGDRVFRSSAGRRILANAESHTVHYGFVVDDDTCSAEEYGGDGWREHILDEVLATVFRAPRSFTAEDTVEISCHGGVLVMQEILQAVCRSGARLAEPGEFTRRAFLNGRIDLSEAEAVMDLIGAQNEYALKASVGQLQGKLYEKIKELRERILYETAFIESALDDPEHFDLTDYPERLAGTVSELKGKIEDLGATFQNGKLIKEGISTVIVGKPNAGKSSLLNMLVGEERAIVTEIAGTTRDALMESVRLGGISLNLIDTAGIRDTADVVERIGVERAKRYVADADLILYVVDGSVPLDENDAEIMELIRDKKVIVLLNKSDLDTVVEERMLCRDYRVIRTSAALETGLRELEQTVKKLFFNGELGENHELVITNVRHSESLKRAAESLELVLQSIEAGMSEDFYTIDLMNAYTSLGAIIGEEVGDDLVDEIFSKFCMGK